MKKWFSIIILIFFLNGCYSIQKDIYIKKDGFTKFLENIDCKQDYKEWAFISLGKDLSGGGICYNGVWICGYRLYDIDDYEQYFKNYFAHYTTLKKLEKKWKNKHRFPEFDEFLHRSYLRQYLDD